MADKPIESWSDLAKFKTALDRAYCDLMITWREMEQAYEKARRELMQNIQSRP